MSDTVIKVENLSKSYLIRHQGRERYTALRDVLSNGVKGISTQLLGRTNGHADVTREEFWALNDVSFEVKQGERVGIIGRNGAGKSTLLKILSRITEPTRGRIHIKGRVASLLEVGTGFHPELTGRENIYLNGAILGMTREEIRRKFDEIVAFAEVEKFLDTPVKRYSSGMYVRLAFAVAAHLEPEILVVDEVLAVGDVAFQKKCLGKMKDVAQGGRTVLFVSHNMAAILGLCERTILLNYGQTDVDGNSRKVIDHYIQSIDRVANSDIAERIDRKGNGTLRFDSFELKNLDGERIPVASCGQDLILALYYQAASNSSLKDTHIAIGVHGRFDENLFHLSTDISGFNFDELPLVGAVLCKIDRLPLQPGKYSFNLFCKVAGEISDWIENAGVIEVEPGNFFGSGKLPPIEQGPFFVPHSWAVVSEDSYSPVAAKL